MVHAVGLEVAELDADERHCEKLNAVMKYSFEDQRAPDEVGKPVLRDQRLRTPFVVGSQSATKGENPASWTLLE